VAQSDGRAGDAVVAGGIVADHTLMAAAPATSGARITGSDAPERREVRVGFIPLTDCASVVIASLNGFDAKHGIRIVLSRQASWAAIRDKLVNGELDAAHVLYGLVYGVHLGIGGPKKDMNILMALSNNGQAITLSNALRREGVSGGETLARVIGRSERQYVFAQTFPTGTHAMWLYYWLAAPGVDPFSDVRSITVPPPQMVSNMKMGNMDGFCVGEPWNSRAILDGIGFTVATSQDIWPDHPEKVLGVTAEFTAACPNTARALCAAVIEAGRWIDASDENRRITAGIVAQAEYIDTDADAIAARMLGQYADGLGRSWNDPNHMKFYNDGAVNYPYLSDGMWFMTQHRRWGLLKEDPDYLAVARRVNRIDLYREAAMAAGAPLPEGEMRSSRLIDGVVWNGSDPQAYAAGFAIHA
jgi:nitrate/nitrite transport system substrate-binding protein